MKIYTAETKTIEPTTYSVWAIDRETKEEVEFQVQAFTTKEAIETARREYTNDNPAGCRIRVCVEERKFEQAKIDWLDRLEANKIKNNARTIGKVKEIDEIIADREKTSKVLEIFGLTEYLEYID